jgi:hypothetical protein
VLELAIDLSAWPAGTRAIYRRERLPPGAQLSFSEIDGHRFQVMLTNQRGARIARLEQVHRQRAAIDDSIGCAERPMLPWDVCSSGADSEFGSAGWGDVSVGESC